jgi:hypothetical protein
MGVAGGGGGLKNYLPRLTEILLISASQVARITSMSHQYPAASLFFRLEHFGELIAFSMNLKDLQIIFKSLI